MTMNRTVLGLFGVTVASVLVATHFPTTAQTDGLADSQTNSSATKSSRRESADTSVESYPELSGGQPVSSAQFTSTNYNQPTGQLQQTVAQQTDPPVLGFQDRYASDIELSQDQSELINRRCRVQLIKEIDVPALEAGQLVAIGVEENEYVQANSPVARLRDETARLQKQIAEKNRNVAKVDAENNNRLKFAREGLLMSQDVLRRKEELYRKGNIPYVDYKSSELEAIQSQLQLDEAGTQKRVSQEKLSLEEVNIKAADDLISRHLVNSLIDGQVAEVYVEVGEWVNRGDKVLRVIQMDKLQILGRADAKQLFPGDVDGKSVKVTLKTPNDRVEQFNGTVTRVNLENSVSDKYFFVVEVDNRKRGNYWLLRPNAEVDISVKLR